MKEKRLLNVLGKVDEKYIAEANKIENLTFLGRLGDYKYYDMDKAIARALEIMEK